MDAEQARAMYERQIDQHGEKIDLVRYSGIGGARAVSASATVRARVSGYGVAPLIGDIRQGDTRVIMLAADLETSGFPLPLLSTDRVRIGGKEFAIVLPDRYTRAIAGTIIAYDFAARG